MKKFVFARYLVRLSGLWSGVLVLGFSFVILLFNTVELLRRTHNYKHITLKHVFPISLMELPNLLDQLTPFIFLFSTMFVLWNLSRRWELVVMRAAGFSIWSLLKPLAVLAGSYGLFYLFFLNPFIASMHKEADRSIAKAFDRSRDLSTLSKTGIWLKQPESDGYLIIHAQAAKNNKNLKNITLYAFSSDSEFINRVDSADAMSIDDGWVLKNAGLSESNELVQEVGDYYWRTSLTMEKLQKSLESAHSLSVWELPSFIHLIENAGFNSTEYRLHWYALLLKPILFISMILLGGSTAFRGMRRNNGVSLIMIGIFMGFGLYLLHYLFYALGTSANLPVWVSALAPTLISLLIALALLLHLEERSK